MRSQEEYPLYLRPPYGAWPKNLELCVTMLPVFWDVDTLDWKSKNVPVVGEDCQKRSEGWLHYSDA